MSTKLPSIELDPEKLDAFLKRAEQCLSPQDFSLLASLVCALSNLRDLLQSKSRSIVRLLRMIFGVKTETSKRVLKESANKDAGVERQARKKGHGRNSAQDYTGANKVAVAHDSLEHGDRCPECEKGRVYRVDPGVLLNFFAAAPIQAILYLLEKFRCNLCGEIFTAEKPPEASEKKYDETVGAMVALARYGFGLPFHRLEKLQAGCGIPLAASTQWEIVNEHAATLKPVFDHLTHEAAQAERIYQDDTHMKVLALNAKKKEREETDGRTGTFTTGLVCESEDRTIACFVTGTQHAGENLRDLLLQRIEELSLPIQMCDALSRNMSADLLTMLCNCMSHARRNFVGVLDAFPEECRFVIENLAKVYHHDALAKERNMSPEERLQFHQKQSGPVMDELKSWMETQLDDKKIEPNSGLGNAIQYMLKRWEQFTLFLRVPGAPLDNNICERALKMAIRHRRNSLFYKTQRGAWVGDLFMSLIHTCHLTGVNAFHYLTTLLRNASELARNPSRWMPWNYEAALSSPP
ncbi:IS66 family transposase [Desulfoferrobacter suflitae]|uniref:IS66 family transposase n=1 Tax=Desulfoferrobacter suflitae TaxID=2865782 RepID=UPI0021644DDF|nr:IS66 family transposase [Desulfoferrobacter suflitae]MCK8604132.1 IS66 family transposase [Desulfoferrobacter suflitae]MCK8604222.1 IS66 family transposase [Desulfoferrobacter suflitae]MCK8604448.1 IS66 family transposase [Desulfoferrobacter suflitae]